MMLIFLVFVTFKSNQILGAWLWILTGLLILKFSNLKNHFLMMLITLEFMSLSGVFFLMSLNSIISSSSSLMFSFMVMMVGEACLGLGLLIFLARIKSKELQVQHLMI